MKERDIPDGGGDGIKVVKISQGSFTERFIKIHHQEGCQGRLHLSSKSPDGVLKGRDVPDGGGDGVKVVKISQGSFTDSFIKIQHPKPSQDSTYH